MKNKIVIIGGGGHSKVIINTLKKLDEYEIIGYTDFSDKGILLGVKYLGTDTVLSEITKTYPKCKAVIGIGGVFISDKREKIFQDLKKMGFDLPVIISKDAIIGEEVKIDEGTIILEEAIVGAGSKIGKCVIINNGAIVEYDCNIDDFVHLTPKSKISYEVNIGRNSFIGTGAIIKNNIKVYKNCFIGAAAVLLGNTIKEGLYLGIPAQLKL